MKKFKPVNILSIGCFLLLVGILSIQAYFSNPIFWAISILSIVSFYFFILIKYKDHFGFILLLFFLSHFSYSDNQGGLWNISAFIIICIFSSIYGLKSFTNKTNRSTLLFISVFIISNLIGIAFKNTSSSIFRFEGVLMLFAYVSIFLFTSNLKLSIIDVRRFIKILYFTSIYLILVALNQRFGVIASELPFLPPKQVIDGKIHLTTNSSSVFGNSELYGEYCILILIIAFAFIKKKAIYKAVYTKAFDSYLLIIFSLLGSLLSGARSAVIFSFATIVLIYFLNSTNFNVNKIFLKILTICAIAYFVLMVSDFDLGIKSSRSDFESLHGVTFNLGSIISGEAINREGPFDAGLVRLNQDNWIIGYGIGPLGSNLIAWWGDDKYHKYVDFHNFYLTAPMIYGYLGLLAFLLLVLQIIFKSMRIILDRSSEKNVFYYYISAMPLFWTFFLLDEWKISFLRNANYSMIVWIFLGLSFAFLQNYNESFRLNSK